MSCVNPPVERVAESPPCQSLHVELQTAIYRHRHGADGIEAIELWIEVHTYFGNKANLSLYYVDIVPFIFCLEAPKSVHKSVTVKATASPTVAASFSRADFPTHSHSRKLTLSSPNLARIQLAPARRQGSPNLHIR